MTCKHNTFEHLASLLLGVISAGGSRGGRAFQFSSHVAVQPGIHALTGRLDQRSRQKLHTKQDGNDEPFVLRCVGDDMRMRTISSHDKQVKLHRNNYDPKGPSSCLLEIVGGRPSLRHRNKSVHSRMLIAGRHAGESAWLTIHASSAAGTLLSMTAGGHMISAQTLEAQVIQDAQGRLCSSCW